MYRFGMFSNSTDGTRQAMYVQCNVEERSHNHCCRQKAVSITYSECVFVILVTQHAKHMHHIILSSVACPAVPYFSALLHKWRDFWKNVIEPEVCVLIFSAAFILKISYSQKNSARCYHKCTSVVI
jgi:hypothetical protein